MGFGLPSAVGVQLAQPHALVVCIAGDGSLQMNIQELATLKSLHLPVKIILLDNAALGMVRQWQYLFYDRRFSHTDLSDNPDFVKVAEAYGLAAWRVEKEKELATALAECFAYEGPGLVSVKISPDANVSPMVKGGDPLDFFTLE
jgi:acetolactate synthase-1/2/3 large subunit